MTYDPFGLGGSAVDTYDPFGQQPDTYDPFQVTAPVQPQAPSWMPSFVTDDDSVLGRLRKDFESEGVKNPLMAGAKGAIMPAITGMSLAGSLYSKIVAPFGIGVAARGLGGVAAFESSMSEPFQAVAGVLSKDSDQSLMEAARQGVAEQKDYFDVLQKHGVQKPIRDPQGNVIDDVGFVSNWLGYYSTGALGRVALDPLTYAGEAWTQLGVGKQILKVAGKGMSGLAGVTRSAAELGISKLSPQAQQKTVQYANFFGLLESPELKQFNEIAVGNARVGSAAEATAEAEALLFNKRLKDIAKEKGVPVEQLKREINVVGELKPKDADWLQQELFPVDGQEMLWQAPAERAREPLEEQLKSMQETLVQHGYKVPVEQADVLTAVKTSPYDQPPDPSKFIDVVRVSHGRDDPKFNYLSSSTFYSLDQNFMADSPSRLVTKVDLTNANPLILETEGKAGLNYAYPALKELVSPEYADNLFAMDERALAIEAQKWGMRKDEVAKVLESKRPTMFIDRIAAEAAKNKGYDSVLWKRPDGGGEFVSLDPSKAFANEIRQQMYKPSISEDVVRLGLEAKDWDTARRAKSVARGIVEPELNDPILDYFTHRTTPELQMYAAKKMKGKGYGMDYSALHARELAREPGKKWMSIEQANVLGETGQAHEVSPWFAGYKGKIFIDDPVQLNLLREIDSIRKSVDTRTILDATNSIGLHNSKAPSDWVPLKLESSEDIRHAMLKPYVQGMRYPAEVAERLNKLVDFDRVPHLDKQVGEMAAELFHAVTSNWKAGAIARPGFLFRNAGGMAWNAWVTDVKPHEFVKGVGITRDVYAGKLKSTVQLYDKIYTDKQLRRMGEELGVASGILRTDVTGERIFGKPLMLYRIPKVGKGFLKISTMFTQMETVGRMGQFMALLDKGKTPLEAASIVKMSQFDYLPASLTPFEQWLRRNGIPFYVWMRRNVPFQLQGLITNPKPFVALSQTMDLLPDFFGTKNNDFKDELEHQELFEEHIKQIGLPVKRGKDGRTEVLVLGSWVPAGDLEMVFRPGSIQAKLLSSINPILTTIPSAAFNVDLQRGGREIGSLPERLGYVVKNLVPPIQALNSMVGPYFEGKLSKRENKSVKKLINWMFGWTTSSIDINEARQRRMRDIRKVMYKHRAALMNGDTDEAADYMKQIDVMYREM